MKMNMGRSKMGRPLFAFRCKSGEKGNAIVWRGEKNDTLLYISGYFDKENLIGLAENVK